MRVRSLYFLGVTTVVVGALFVSSAAPISASSLSTTIDTTSAMTEPGARSQNAGPRAVSHDGRYSVFSSSSKNLVFNDINNISDVFAYDRVTKQVQLISRSPFGPQANGFSIWPTISPDGRYVAYLSFATNITPGEDACEGGGTCINIIVHDRFTKQNNIANRTTDGKRLVPSQIDMPSLSYDGRYIAFNSASELSPSDNNFSLDVAVRDLQTNVTTPVSVDQSGNFANGASQTPTISYDGKRVAFVSWVSLVSADTNKQADIYYRDLQANTLKRISVAPNGGQPNGDSSHSVISGDGKFIAYDSNASNLVQTDANGRADIFLHDIQAGSTKLISKTTKGVQANGPSQLPDISHDGKYIVYTSPASNLVRVDTNGFHDVFRYYRDHGLTRRINVQSGNGAPAVGGGSYRPSVSGDGKAVFYDSDATNLVTPAPVMPLTHMYLTYNPVVDIPFYDPNDVLDIMY